MSRGPDSAGAVPPPGRFRQISTRNGKIRRALNARPRAHGQNLPLLWSQNLLASDCRTLARLEGVAVLRGNTFGIGTHGGVMARAIFGSFQRASRPELLDPYRGLGGGGTPMSSPLPPLH
jgi:hypothetical protein